MKILRLYILYRLPIIIILIVLGVLSHVYNDAVTAWICYILAAFSLFLYFAMGTMRLVQEAVQDGDPELAMKYIKRIKFPRLLLKPIRSGYYMMQSNLSLASDDLSTAESNIRKSMNTKSKIVGDIQGTNLMQLAFIQLKKGEAKEARLNLIAAVRAGIPDKENLAAVYLQLSSIEIQRKQNKVGKEYYRKAKALKPKTPELVKQINDMDKYISRLPG
jgi:small-conductance mechanosensitive channel